MIPDRYNGWFDMKKISLLLIVGVFLASEVAIPLQLVYSQALNFGVAKNLSNTSTDSSNAGIAVSGSNLYVVWEEGAIGSREILFKFSTDNGASFGSAVNLSNTPTDSFDPSIAASGSKVYVVWSETTATPTNATEIFFIAGTSNGATVTFGPAVNLSNSTAGSSAPTVAASGSNVYVVWTETTGNDTNTNDEIFFRRSTDNGSNFIPSLSNPALNLSNTPTDSFDPRIAAFGINVHVVWTETTGNDTNTNEIFFRRSTDGGITFKPSPSTTALNLSNTPNVRSSAPHLAASGSSLYVVWEEGAIPMSEIFFRRSTDNGSSFIPSLSNPALNLSNTLTDSFDPRIAVSGINVHVVWSETTGTDLNPNDEIFFRLSIDNGASFGSTVNLSNTPKDSNQADIAVSGSNVYVVWTETTGTDTNTNDEIFFVKAPNSLPVANSQSVTTNLNTPKTITLTASDVDGDSLTFSIVAIPSHGLLGTVTQLTPTSAQVTYTPTTGFTGPDSFTFKANDGKVDSNNATVSISVGTVSLKGDLTGDGKITVSDLIKLADGLSGRAPLSPENQMRADVFPAKSGSAATCGDGSVDINDLLALVDIALSRTTITAECG